MPLPGVPGAVTALSPDDIWALGQTPKTVLKNDAASILMHWNGKSWHTVAVPKVRVPAGANEYVGDLAAAGPADVWLQRDIEQGTAAARTLYLLNWEGKSWHRIRIGFPTSDVDYLAPDGHGGVWMVANGSGPDYRWYLYHLNAGHWIRYSVPAAKGTSLLDLTGISWVPGTRSMWAAGNMARAHNSDDIVGAILKYGP